MQPRKSKKVVSGSTESITFEPTNSTPQSPLVTFDTLIGNDSDKFFLEPAVDFDGSLAKIKFLSSGLTSLGNVFREGEVLEIEIPGSEYERTKDINGNSWLDLAGDPDAQIARWGRVMFVEIG